MKLRTTVRTLALLLFSGLFLFAGYRIVSYYGETRAQEAAFGTLQERVAKGTSAGPSSTAGAAAPAEDSGEEGASAVLPEYAALHQEKPRPVRLGADPGYQAELPGHVHPVRPGVLPAPGL